MNVAIYGASDKSSRYSYLAHQMLKENGHQTYPIHPTLDELQGDKVFRNLNEIDDPIDTLTLYVGSPRQMAISEDILAAPLRRVIFNPGTENPELAQKLRDKGVQVTEACSLVLMRTGQW